MDTVCLTYKIIALGTLERIAPVASGLNGFDHLHHIPLKTLQDEFGHKLANSVRAAQLTATHADAQMPIGVPKFAGLPQSYLIRILDQNGILSRLWQRYNQVKSDPVQRSHAVDQINHLIAQTFSPTSAVALELTDALREEFGADTRLALRSTSREDTKESANAGGNESVSNVAITPEAISSALCVVLSSYFADQSIGRRSINDTNVIEMPLLAAMFQKMVTDSPGPRPTVVSGVLGSVETFGQTPNVTLIQSTYGHGSGIVDSALDVAADSVLVGPNFQIRETGHKTIRALPSLESPDHTEDTDSSLADLDSTSSDMALLLKSYAERCAREFKGPVDIEWVFDRAQNQLWIVQVRPLILEEELDPQYLRLNPGATPLMNVKVESGNMNVVEINRPTEEILFAKTDVEALGIIESRALVRRGTPLKTKVVILQKPPKTLSHEVMELRSNGIIVLVASEELGPIKDAVRKRVPLTICTQQGLICTSNNVTVETGFAAYPKQFKRPNIIPSASVKRIFRNLTLRQPLAMPDDILARLTYNFNAIKTRVRDGQDYSLVLVSTAELLVHLKLIVNRYPPDIFQNCGQMIDNALACLDIILSHEPGNKATNFMVVAQLESIIAGASDERSTPDSIAGYVELMAQYETFARITRDDATLIRKPELRIPGFRLWAHRLSGLSDPGNRWLRFCIEHCSPDTHFNEVDSALRFLSRHHQIESVAVAKLGHPELAWPVIQSTTQELDALQAQIKIQKRDLKTLQQIRWDAPMDPADFTKFCVFLEGSIGAPNIGTIWETLRSTEARRFLLDHMLFLVNSYDQAIKTVLGSTHINDGMKVTRIAEMLNGFVTILEAFSNLRPSCIPDQLRPHLEARIAHYRTWLSTPQFDSDNKDFNVAKWTFGHPYWLNHDPEDREFVRQKPVNPKEFFTAIHQDLMSIIQLEQAGLIGELDSFPDAHVAIHKAVMTQVFSSRQLFFQISCISSRITDQSVETQYNIPLRYHSCSVTTVSNRRTNEIEVSISMYGPDQNARWTSSSVIIKLLEILGLTSQTSCSIMTDGTSINFKISPKSDAPTVLVKAIKILIPISFGATDPDETVLDALSDSFPPPSLMDASAISIVESLRYFGAQLSDSQRNTNDILSTFSAKFTRFPEILTIEAISKIPEIVELLLLCIPKEHPAYLHLIEKLVSLARNSFEFSDNPGQSKLLFVFLKIWDVLVPSPLPRDEFISNYFRGAFERIEQKLTRRFGISCAMELCQLVGMKQGKAIVKECLKTLAPEGELYGDLSFFLEKRRSSVGIDIETLQKSFSRWCTTNHLTPDPDILEFLSVAQTSADSSV